MGSFAKRLGQVAARSLESESSQIHRTAAANKVPGSLSLALDGTLKRGHDMRVFGLGTAASLANRQRYARFTGSMLSVYSAMEEELDSCCSTQTAVATVWARHGTILRRSASLRADLADVVEDVEKATAQISPATASYISGIRAAAASDRAGGARLLGHVYCRYFADLFGGQALAGPTRAALALKPGTPRHYMFDLPEDETLAEPTCAKQRRRAFIEAVYRSINEAGQELSPEAFQAVIDEALLAFKSNVAVYSEEPMLLDSIRGALNVGTGFLAGGLYGL